MSVRLLGAAALLVISTLWVQIAGMAALIAWVRQTMSGEIRTVGAFRSAVLVVRLTAALIVLHGFHVLLWASWYRWVSFPSWEVALYFSATSYTTLGYGDVTLPQDWRILGPLEGMSGVLISGVSVSLLFAIIARLVGPQSPRQS
jgi:hypothetical protein